MSIETRQPVFVSEVWVVGLAGVSAPAGPRLRGAPRGIRGNAPKSKTKGGWRQPPCLPALTSSSKT